MALLAVVFVAFGVWAEAAMPMLESARDHGSAPDLLTLGAWALGR
jgi:hypothetical protein